jgi:hypothetical protein
MLIGLGALFPYSSAEVTCDVQMGVFFEVCSRDESTF